MKEELIIKVLSRASDFLDEEQTRKLRMILDTELYDYRLESEVRALVPVNKSSEVLKLYLASKKLDGLSINTLKSYHRYLTKFLRCLQKEVEQITTMDCRVFLAGYSSSGVKNTTLNTLSTILKSFFGWLHANEYISKNPMITIKTIKTDKYIRKALTTEEYELLRDACTTIRDRALVEFFYSTGCRLDEVYKLNRYDVTTDKVVVFGKGSKERIVFLSSCARVHLQKYLSSRTDKTEALFVGERAPHERLGRRAIQRVFSLLGQRAGITKPVYPHLLRHTTATHMLRRGASLSEVQRILGHSSPATTTIYAQLDTDSLQASHSKHVA